MGTARFQALSGAFGALGGDLSALNVNPAGSAVFKNSLLTVSGTNYNQNNDATYFNRLNSRDLNSVELNQVGGVFVFDGTGKQFRMEEKLPWRSTMIWSKTSTMNSSLREIALKG